MVKKLFVIFFFFIISINSIQAYIKQEIIANSWLNTPSNQTLLFDTPINQRWQRAAEQIVQIKAKR